MKLLWTWADRLANVATILVACGVGYFLLQRQATGSQPDRAVRLAPIFKVGETLPTLPNVDYSAAQRTLLAVVRSGCHFCIESMPFYRRLVTERDDRKAPVRVVAVAPAADPSLWEETDAAGFKPDAKIVSPQGKLKIRATPTLLLVNSSGQLLQMWEGRLPDQLEAQVLDAVLAPRGVAARSAGDAPKP